jgi:formyltetrahydrofolate-dependent phosphoribosylglycinamide formyltransferase
MTAVRPPPKSTGRILRLGVLVSGGGSTLANFLEKIATGELRAEVCLVVASRSDCGAVARAHDAGLRCDVVDRRAFPGVAEFSRAIFDRCRECRVDLVTLAGFLALIDIPDDFRQRVMNIHPALIPAFCGKGFYGHKVHEAVLERGAKVSGCTVHFADNHYDHGPIILQSCVPVRDDDTADSLAARIFAAECQAYPEAIRLFAEDRLEIDNQRVRILALPHPSALAQH